jgi:hypothetical protein
MRLVRGTLTVATLAAAATLVALLGAHALGAAVPGRAVLGCAGVVVPLAAAAAVQRAVHLWRGPPVVSFSNADAVRCGGADAEAVRVAARLRGTLGGAGHLFPGRVALHAVACLAAAALGAYVLVGGEDTVGGWLPAVFAAGGAGVVLLPARPFYYREAMNGEVLVTPAIAPSLLAWERSAAVASGRVVRAAPSPLPDRGNGRGNSPTGPAIASKPADAGMAQER